MQDAFPLAASTYLPSQFSEPVCLHPPSEDATMLIAELALAQARGGWGGSVSEHNVGLKCYQFLISKFLFFRVFSGSSLSRLWTLAVRSHISHHQSLLVYLKHCSSNPDGFLILSTNKLQRDAA